MKQKDAITMALEAMGGFRGDDDIRKIEETAGLHGDIPEFRVEGTVNEWAEWALDEGHPAWFTKLLEDIEADDDMQIPLTVFERFDAYASKGPGWEKSPTLNEMLREGLNEDIFVEKKVQVITARGIKKWIVKKSGAALAAARRAYRKVKSKVKAYAKRYRKSSIGKRLSKMRAKVHARFKKDSYVSDGTEIREELETVLKRGNPAVQCFMKAAQVAWKLSDRLNEATKLEGLDKKDLEILKTAATRLESLGQDIEVYPVERKTEAEAKASLKETLEKLGSAMKLLELYEPADDEDLAMFLSDWDVDPEEPLGQAFLAELDGVEFDESILTPEEIDDLDSMVEDWFGDEEDDGEEEDDDEEDFYGIDDPSVIAAGPYDIGNGYEEGYNPMEEGFQDWTPEQRRKAAEKAAETRRKTNHTKKMNKRWTRIQNQVDKQERDKAWMASRKRKESKEASREDQRPFAELDEVMSHSERVAAAKKAAETRRKNSGGGMAGRIRSDKKKANDARGRRAYSVLQRTRSNG